MYELFIASIEVDNNYLDLGLIFDVKIRNTSLIAHYFKKFFHWMYTHFIWFRLHEPHAGRGFQRSLPHPHTRTQIDPQAYTMVYLELYL